jgi:elongation factor Ts
MEPKSEISTAAVKELRERTGAGVMACRNALLEVRGDMDEAAQILQQQGLAKASKKADRATSQGIIEAYIHLGGRLGAMVELNCESDFVARTDEFKALAHDLAMQVAACSPQFVSSQDIPAGDTAEEDQDCLLSQPFIRDPQRTVNDLVTEAIAKTGENIRVRRFARFELDS